MTNKAWLGAAFTITTGIAVSVLLGRAPGAGTLARRLVDHAVGSSDTLYVRFDQRPALSPGDPVYSVYAQSFALHGRVAALEGSSPCRVTLELDPLVCRTFHENTRAIAMEPDGNLAWVLRTLVPPPLREKIRGNLSALWEHRRADTFSRLKPHLIALLGDLANILSDTLPDALLLHSAEKDTFVKAFTSVIFPTHLGPTLKTEVVTRLEDRLAGLASDLGKDIWAKVTMGDLLGVAWTATKVKTGLASDSRMSKELGGILEKRALPIFKKRTHEILEAALGAVAEALEQPKLREAIDTTAWETLRHPAFEAFAGPVAKTWLLENRRLHDTLNAALRSSEIREPIEDLWTAAEPLLEEALEDMLTRPDGKGMDHQLVRVLRKVVLKKDKHYIVLKDEGFGRLRARTEIRGLKGEDL